MEFNHTIVKEAIISFIDQRFNTKYTALGIVHLVVVVVPTLVLAPIVLYCLCKLMKTSGINLVSLLYSFLVLLCMLAPLSYGILWDISLITGIPIFGNCTSPHPVYAVQYWLEFGFGMAVSVTIAMIAVLQFMILQCSKRVVNLKYVMAVYAALIIFSFCVSCTFFNGGYTEIRGSHCKGYFQSGLINSAVWTFLAFAVPIVLTVIFSILTCLKVTNDISAEAKSVVRYVVVLNTVTIFSHLVLRVMGTIMYFTVVSINPAKDTLYLWTMLARYVTELAYTETIVSVVILHSSVRKMVSSCVKRSSRDTMDITKDVI